MSHLSQDDREVWQAFRGHSRTFSLAARLLPPQVRDHVANVYLLCRRIDTIADDLVLEIGREAAIEALDDLEEALDRTVNGRPPEHWIWPRLARTHRAYPLRTEPIKELIAGARWDLDGRPILTRSDLISYSELVGGTVGEIMLPFLVERPADVDVLAPIARSLGVAMQITNIVRDVGEDWRIRRRVYIPASDLDDAGVNLGALSTDGRATEAYVDVLERLMDEADMRYEAASRAIDALHPSSRAAIRAAVRMYREIMNEVRANDYDNLTQRAYVPLWRKLSLLVTDRYAGRRQALRLRLPVTSP
jgi:15-cis-phytoene synthase